MCLDKVCFCKATDEQFYELFQAALRCSAKRALFLLPSEEILRKCKAFLAARNARVFEKYVGKECFGFFLYTVADKPKLESFSFVGILDSDLVPELTDIVRYCTEYTIPFLATAIKTPQEVEEPGIDFWSGGARIPDAEICCPQNSMLLENEKIRKMFVDTFLIAKTEIDIICPWINQTVVNDDLIALIGKALARNVKIKILYGIGNVEEFRTTTSEETVTMLRTRFKKYGNRLSLHRGNTHVKLLLCDTKYMMIGSYNFLSFAGEYIDSNERGEAVEYEVDAVKIARRRLHFFDW